MWNQLHLAMPPTVVVPPDGEQHLVVSTPLRMQDVVPHVTVRMLRTRGVRWTLHDLVLVFARRITRLVAAAL
jgi:hypothetical protein